MAIVGCLGSVIFTVSDSTVCTVDNLVWSGSARYAVHQRHGGSALTEFTGLDPDKLTFDMTMTAELGVNPASEINHLAAMKQIGAAVPFVLGNQIYGKFRWTITNLQVKSKFFDARGNLYAAAVSVTLQEYLPV